MWVCECCFSTSMSFETIWNVNKIKYLYNDYLVYDHHTAESGKQVLCFWNFNILYDVHKTDWKIIWCCFASDWKTSNKMIYLSIPKIYSDAHFLF